jgi:hypothetical protein
MKLLYIKDIVNQDYAALEVKIYVLVALYIVAIFAILLDLWSGVRKAKKRGEFISSYGLRRTVDKMVKYLNLMLCFTLIDIVLSLIESINLPFATMIATMLVCVIEIKSIYEKFDQKEKVREAAKTLGTIIKNRNDLLNAFEQFGQNEANKAKENTNQKTNEL